MTKASEHALRVAVALHARLRMRLVLVQVLSRRHTAARGINQDTARATLMASMPQFGSKP